MGTFDFLGGQPTAPAGYNPQAMQAYAPAMNTGSTQGMDYSQVLGGGQAQSPATQGLDFSQIGQWALNQPGSNSGGYAQALGGLANQAHQSPIAPGQMAAHPMAAGRAGHALGQVQQGSAGYLGQGAAPMMGNQAVGLLGRMQ